MRMVAPGRRAVSLGVALLVAAVSLTGCIGSGVPAADPDARPPSGPPATNPAAVPTPSESAACSGVVQPWGECTNWRLVWVTSDSGPVPHAMGTVDRDEYGDPMAYHVVADDVYMVIAERLGDSSDSWLSALNCFRRKDRQVFVGDVLNLSPYTIETIGSENGSTTPRDQARGESCLAQPNVPPQE